MIEQFDACASWWTQGPDATLQVPFTTFEHLAMLFKILYLVYGRLIFYCSLFSVFIKYFISTGGFLLMFPLSLNCLIFLLRLVFL